MSEKFVHIDIVVDITEPEQISALSTFLTKVGQNAEAHEPEPKPQSEKPVKPVKPTKPARTSKTDSEKPESEHEPEPKPGKPESENEPEPKPGKPAAEEKTYQVEEVREKLKDKVSEHREEIKAKLTELGAPNVSSLDPSKYTEFVNFLEGLE